MVVVVQQQDALLVVLKGLRATRAHDQRAEEAVHLLDARMAVPEVRAGLLVHLPGARPCTLSVLQPRAS